MEFTPVPPLLALLSPTAPTAPTESSGIPPETLDLLQGNVPGANEVPLDLVVDVELPDEPVTDVPFDQLLARAEDQEPLLDEAPPETAVFVPASVESLVRDARTTNGPRLEAARPTEPRRRLPRAIRNRPEPSVARPVPTRLTPTVTRPAYTPVLRSPMELLRSPEMQAPASLELAGPEAEPIPEMTRPIPPVPTAESTISTPARPIRRATARPVTTAASLPTTVPSADEPEPAFQLEAPTTDVAVEAPLPTEFEVPELAAPVPQRVTVKVDEDLDIEVSSDSDGIGVVLEGTAEAVEPLREIATDLAEELARSGLELTEFEARDRDGQDTHELRSTGSHSASAATASDDEPTSTHDGLVEVIA
ncbi:MAG: hypothetical protein GY913_23375 [Proteobacteria bacterium]|nr:hypothetical protein [Pseudomonadota bacterium]MCP4919854.1 hypothetical protein [Pseudomonadota bacterium]